MPSDIVTNIRWLRFSWFECEDVLRKTKLHSMLINTTELINQTVRLQNPSPFFSCYILSLKFYQKSGFSFGIV